MCMFCEFRLTMLWEERDFRSNTITQQCINFINAENPLPNLGGFWYDDVAIVLHQHRSINCFFRGLSYIYVDLRLFFFCDVIYSG